MFSRMGFVVISCHLHAVFELLSSHLACFFFKCYDLDAQVRLQKVEKKQPPEVDQISNELTTVIL